MRACPETIYQALFAGVLGPIAGKLRTGRQRRKPQRRGVPTKNKIANMRLLDQRPAEVAERRTIGHWEGDLIIGANMRSAIGTLVERVSRYVVLVHLPDGYTAPVMRDALTARLLELPPALRQTLTWDQGRELTLHEQIEAASGIRIFFCEPRVALAATDQREHQRTAPPVLPEAHQPRRAHPSRPRPSSPPNSTIGPASSSVTARRTRSWQTSSSHHPTP